MNTGEASFSGLRAEAEARRAAAGHSLIANRLQDFGGAGRLGDGSGGAVGGSRRSAGARAFVAVPGEWPWCQLGAESRCSGPP